MHWFYKSINKDSVLFKFRIISVPWSDSCTQQRSQGKESFSAQLSCPSACSKRCGSFFPQAPAHESTCSLPQDTRHFDLYAVYDTMLLLLQIFSQPVFPPDDKLGTSPVGTAQCGPLQWPHPWWNWCQCTSQNDWSYHSEWFWHYQRLRRKNIFYQSRSSERRDPVDYEDCLITLHWCFAHTLQDWVRFKNLLLNPGVLAAHCSQELQHELGALSFPCSRLSTDGENKEVSMCRENAFNNVLCVWLWMTLWQV